MACDITLNLFGETVTSRVNLISESGETLDPIEGFANQIKSNPELREQLLKIITDTQKIDVKNPKWTKDKNAKVEEGFHGNVTYNELKEICPITGGWPDLSELEDFGEEDRQILYTEYFWSGGFKQDGIVHDTITGKDIYVVNSKNIEQLRNYLQYKLLVQKMPEDQITIELKTACETLNKKKSIKDILLDFYLNPKAKRFDKSIKVEGKTFSIKNILQQTQNKLLDRKNVQYNDEFCNVVKNAVKYISASKKYRLDYDSLFEVLGKYIKEKENPTDFEKEILEISKNIKSLSGTEKVDILDKILIYAHSLDPEFTYKRVEKPQPNWAIVANEITTLGERYGEGLGTYENQVRLVDSDYLGYRIYEFKPTDTSPIRYIYSQGIITKNDQTRPSNTLEEVQEKIRKKVQETPLSKTNLFIKQQTSQVVTFTYTGDQSFKPGQIIRTLDIEIPKVTLNKDEQQVYYGKLSDFYNYIHRIITNNNSLITKQEGKFVGAIPQIINTPEKAACFLYLINANKENREKKKIINQQYYDMVNEILHTIETAKYKYQMVNSFNNSYAQLIDVEDTFDGFKEESKRPIPTIRVLKALEAAINNKLTGTGITMKLLTQEELIDELKEKGISGAESIGTNKAFLLGNTIYVNKTTADISDPLHEYAHVFLGILKAKNFELYNNLLNAIIEANSSAAERIRKDFEKDGLYKGLSDYDLKEEIVATMYGRHIVNNKFLEFSKIEQLDQAVTTTVNKTIFDQTDSIVHYHDRKLGLLAQLNMDMQHYLAQTRGEPFVEVFKRTGEFRQATQAIQRDIDKKLLKEDCDR